MAILTFLFFSSLFYFTLSSEVPVQSQSEEYEKNIQSLLNVVSTGMNKYIMPMLTEYNQEDKDYMTSVALQGFKGYLNYLLYLAEVADKPKKDDDIIVLLNAPNPIPFAIPHQNPGAPDCNETNKNQN